MKLAVVPNGDFSQCHATTHFDSYLTVFVLFISVNMSERYGEYVGMSDFELLRVLGTGGEFHSLYLSIDGRTDGYYGLRNFVLGSGRGGRDFPGAERQKLKEHASERASEQAKPCARIFWYPRH